MKTYRGGQLSRAVRDGDTLNLSNTSGILEEAAEIQGATGGPNTNITCKSRASYMPDSGGFPKQSTTRERVMPYGHRDKVGPY